MPDKADIEKPITLVKPTHAKSVQAILDRAHKQERSADKSLARSAQKALRPVRSKGVLSKALGMAMAHHGKTKKGAVSLRPKAPDTGGRSFHFSHSTVGKTPGAKGAAGGGDGGAGPAAGDGGGGSHPDGSGGGGPTAGSGGRGASPGPAHPDLGSKEAGHQRYVERDSALARDAKEVFGIPVGKDAGMAEGMARDGQSRDRGEGWERDPAAQREHAEEKKAKPVEIDMEALKKEIEQAARGQRTQSARAAQEYIEDVSKVAPQTRHGHSNSFGTIGETFDERVAFWNDVHKHEREKDARTQIRLVLELPHEATPEARQEIVREFCKQYEELGVPYWASIHAPTKKNDDRNFHAHIVHGIRPTQRRLDPSTGKMAWDFTITEEYRKKNRVKKTRHPFRQNVVAAFRNRDYVRDTRKLFAETANAVLEKHGSEIRYDHRSYKDMGLDIEPMKHVSRIVADKSKTRDFVVLDAAWTKRLIEQEVNAAAVERDKTYVELKAVEQKLTAISGQISKLRDANAKLPNSMKLSPLSKLTVTTARRLTQRMLEIEREKIAQRFADESAARTIQHIIDATAPISAHRNGQPRKVSPKATLKDAPSPEAMALLHASAKEEMRLHRIATSGRKRRLGLLAAGAFAEWRAEANPPPPMQPPPPAAQPSANAQRGATAGFAPPGASQTQAASRQPAGPSKAMMAAMQPPPVTRAPPVRPRTYYPIYRDRPETALEVIERAMPGNKPFPKFMHDYAIGMNASVRNSVEAARAAGPVAMQAMWDRIKETGIPLYKGKQPEEIDAAAPTMPMPTGRQASAGPAVEAKEVVAQTARVRATTPGGNEAKSPIAESGRPMGNASTTHEVRRPVETKAAEDGKGRTTEPKPAADGNRRDSGRQDASEATRPGQDDRARTEAQSTMRTDGTETRPAGGTPGEPVSTRQNEAPAAASVPSAGDRTRSQQPTRTEGASPIVTEPSGDRARDAARNPTMGDVRNNRPDTDAKAADGSGAGTRAPAPATGPRPTAPGELTNEQINAIMIARAVGKPLGEPPRRILRPSDFVKERGPLSKDASKPLEQFDMGFAPLDDNTPLSARAEARLAERLAKRKAERRNSVDAATGQAGEPSKEAGAVRDGKSKGRRKKQRNGRLIERDGLDL